MDDERNLFLFPPLYPKTAQVAADLILDAE